MYNTPIFITNFNRLSTTERLVDQLLVLGYDIIFVLDMGSTYKPLLEYYNTNHHIRTVYLENAGQQALWKTGLISHYIHHPWIAITDSDIELNENTPKNFVEELINVAKDFRVDKAGLALKIDDLPNNFLTSIIKPIEQQYWEKRLHHEKEIYDAALDTTFSVIRPNRQFQYNAVRVAGDFTCKHIPWYTDFNNLSEEEQFFIDKADTRYSTYKQHYLNWKRNNATTGISNI